MLPSSPKPERRPSLNNAGRPNAIRIRSGVQIIRKLFTGGANRLPLKATRQAGFLPPVFDFMNKYVLFQPDSAADTDRNADDRPDNGHYDPENFLASSR